MFPTDEAADRYWFTRNLPLIDRGSVQRRLWWRARSPVFAVTVFAALIPILINMTKRERKTLFRIAGFRLTPGTLAFAFVL